MTELISRRTVLKGLGVAAGSAALGSAPPPPAEALQAAGPCFIYLDHAARNAGPSGQWVVAALLVSDPRLPRQILRRAKRHRLSKEDRTVAEITARQASTEFKKYFYKRLGTTPSVRPWLDGVQGGQSAPGAQAHPHPTHYLELYSVRASQAVLRAAGERVGHFQLYMLQALLRASVPWRFREVFVYHNLPSLRQVSEQARRAGLLQAAGLHVPTGMSLPLSHRGSVGAVWEHAAVWTSPTFPGLLVDEGIQVADLAAYAFYQKYQHGNARWYNMIRPRVRREINALALLPAFRLLG
jgi:hypothetical protein